MAKLGDKRRTSLTSAETCTVYGKSPCDGIGGTVKLSAARASLQATTTTHILNPRDFSWAEKNIKNIHFFWTGKEAVAQNEKSLQKRFLNSTTIPGTREHHSFIHFIPHQSQLQVSRVSASHSFLLDMSGSRPQVMNKAAAITVKSVISLADMIPGGYVVCLYDQHWWIIGNICATSEQEQDVQVKFMHPHGPSRNYSYYYYYYNTMLIERFYQQCSKRCT